jgi:hypothetical protein
VSAGLSRCFVFRWDLQDLKKNVTASPMLEIIELVHSLRGRPSITRFSSSVYLNSCSSMT